MFIKVFFLVFFYIFHLLYHNVNLLSYYSFFKSLCHHFPDTNLYTKLDDLKTQSIIIAHHTPIAPILNTLAINSDVPNLNTAIEKRLTLIVNLTSLPALNAFGNIKLSGHINMATPICIHTNIAVSSFVASDTLYIEINIFWKIKCSSKQ